MTTTTTTNTTTTTTTTTGFEFTPVSWDDLEDLNHPLAFDYDHPAHPRNRGEELARGQELYRQRQLAKLNG